MRKYRNVPTEIDGIRFASKKEAHRYCELRLLEKAGHIRDLRLQPRFPLTVEGRLICTYVGDFGYHDVKQDREIVEDSKGFRTKEFDIKAKLFAALHKAEIVLT